MDLKRRIGKADSKTRKMILDVAETIMLESGYASVTSRKIASRAEVSFQLVHYYFRSMDDLLIEILQRSTDLYQSELDRIAESDRPLTELWRMNSESRRSALSVQFMALSTHNERVRIALKEFGDQFRVDQIEVINNYIGRNLAINPAVSAVVLAISIEHVARQIVFGDTLGQSIGHAKTAEFFEQVLRSIEDTGRALPFP